jgi:hypothetical protein|tara:strand:- start:2440 stop:2580 length:141 start_codon:yes stop_codon:yes gene_type:complete
MPVGKLVVEHDGDRVVLLPQLAFQLLHLVLGNLQAGPAIPLEGGGF